MKTEGTNIDFDQSPRWRFQFGLKTAFLLLTLVSMWLAIYVFRTQRAEAVLSRAANIYGTIADALDTPPEGTAIVTPDSRADFRTPLPRRRHIVRTNRLADSRISFVQLRLNQELLSAPEPELKRSLIEHYLQNLNEYGLEQDLEAQAPVIAVGDYLATWRDPDPGGFTVTLSISPIVQSLTTVILQAEVDQPVFLRKSWAVGLVSAASFVIGWLLLLVILRTIRWGWFAHTPAAAQAGPLSETAGSLSHTIRS